MGSHRRLAGYVIVDGKPYGPHDDLPERTAVRITNPAAWEPDTHLTSTAVGASPAPVTPTADAPDQATTSQDDIGAPDTAVPDIALVDGGAAQVTPDMVVPDELTVTRDEIASPNITAPDAGTDELEVPAAVSPPPRSGKGSGIEAWRTYARAMQVAVSDGAERADIISACEKAGQLPPQ